MSEPPIDVITPCRDDRFVRNFTSLVAPGTGRFKSNEYRNPEPPRVCVVVRIFSGR